MGQGGRYVRRYVPEVRCGHGEAHMRQMWPRVDAEEHQGAQGVSEVQESVLEQIEKKERTEGGVRMRDDSVSEEMWLDGCGPCMTVVGEVVL